MQSLTGNVVAFQNRLEVEWDGRKREWLKVFSRPDMLMKDVGELNNGKATNYMDNKKWKIPLALFIFTSGFSCTDLSTLNKHSHAYKGDCVATGAGTTGKTWSGNYAYVLLVKPALVIIENVKAAMKGKNFEQLKQDMTAAGYKVAALILNSATCGLPQDRDRAYFVCVREELTDDSWEDKFFEVVEDLKRPEPMPLSRFVLPDSHPYVQAVLAEKQEKQAKMAMKKIKKRPAKAEPANKRKKGMKWVVDHWRVRRGLGMKPVAGAVPPSITEVAERNAMCDRERDLLQMVCEAPSTDRKKMLSVELKHSAPRVVKTGGRRRQHCTSCLLPSSKMMVFPPTSDSTRFLTGLEALSLQGVPHSFHESTRVLKDSEYMSLAGNAFSGGCWGLAVLAALSTMNLEDMD